MNDAYFLLGSNMGNSAEQLATACSMIADQLGNIHRSSSVYRTAAWGLRDQPDFLNQVIRVDCRMTALQAIEKVLAIEQSMGRTRTKKNAPRIIDIDILYFNNDIIDLPHLQVPHPAIQARRFVLVPLNEIAPRFVHPVLHVSNRELLDICTDPLDVKKI